MDTLPGLLRVPRSRAFSLHDTPSPPAAFGSRWLGPRLRRSRAPLSLKGPSASHRSLQHVTTAGKPANPGPHRARSATRGGRTRRPYPADCHPARSPRPSPAAPQPDILRHLGVHTGAWSSPAASAAVRGLAACAPRERKRPWLGRMPSTRRRDDSRPRAPPPGIDDPWESDASFAPPRELP